MMAKYKIKFDRKKCIGALSCAAECPDNWEMQDDGKSDCKYKEFGEDKLECNMAAAKACPVKAIQIYDTETDKKLV